ncbi:protein Red isoform X2 [Neocloeon triangulifer]|uniref:protein Red isoform X2 n=1 Tax=Neocloeon triangulifer TaxID=2078957 RepID=UPI00286F493F|nr:protein Red isoform X2 [Neocloeon triangulifer]
MDDHDEYHDRSSKLTNDDFRKLLMTPAHPSHSSSASSSANHSSSSSRAAPSSVRDIINKKKSTGEEDRAEKRRKKKSYFAKLKKQEDDKIAELALKYRDRARERRDGANPDYQAEDPMSSAGAYRAVAPDVKSGMDAAERRRQQIQESKFLGGDMEHTHLVKGLDYALLQKVRSEIVTKEQEHEEELENLVAPSKDQKVKREVEEEVELKTKAGKSIYRAALGLDIPRRNDLFAPGRMAYLIELEDENAESDIPTTILRSRADCPGQEAQATLSTNDIVINKLAQILSYLRQGKNQSKKAKKLKERAGMEDAPSQAKPRTEDSIYGDIGDYMPSNKKGSSSHGKKSGPYFAKPALDEEGENRTGFKLSYADALAGRSASDPQAEQDRPSKRKDGKSAQMMNKLAAEPEGYAECYPGMEEMHDAVDDSDDEADYSKMDMGNKKGPIGRWDFDTQEEYSDYMNNKEALPKAAFQYGVKMADGRRTRKYNKEKNEKAELDREWQKIQNIIHKRKGDSGPSSSTREAGSPEFKKPRH